MVTTTAVETDEVARRGNALSTGGDLVLHRRH
jgi:hypothetical protein